MIGGAGYCRPRYRQYRQYRQVRHARRPSFCPSSASHDPLCPSAPLWMCACVCVYADLHACACMLTCMCMCAPAGVCVCALFVCVCVPPPGSAGYALLAFPRRRQEGCQLQPGPVQLGLHPPRLAHHQEPRELPPRHLPNPRPTVLGEERVSRGAQGGAAGGCCGVLPAEGQHCQGRRILRLRRGLPPKGRKRDDSPLHNGVCIWCSAPVSLSIGRA